MTPLYETERIAVDLSIVAPLYEAALAMKKAIKIGIVYLLLVTAKIKVIMWMNVKSSFSFSITNS